MVIDRETRALRYKLLLLAIGFSVFSFANNASAENIYSAVDDTGRMVTCQENEGKASAGKMVRNVFVAYSTTLKSLKAKLAKEKRAKRPNSVKIAKLNKDIKTYRGMITRDQPICEENMPAGTPNPQLTPTPTPASNPISTPNVRPTATATSTPSGSFDSNGNTTAFGIPAGYVGNKIQGTVVFNQWCLGCHSEKTGRTYPQVKTALSTVARMKVLPLSTQEIAHVTAFLNRFKP